MGFTPELIVFSAMRRERGGEKRPANPVSSRPKRRKAVGVECFFQRHFISVGRKLYANVFFFSVRMRPELDDRRKSWMYMVWMDYAWSGGCWVFSSLVSLIRGG